MRKSLFLAAVLLLAVSGFASTTYNNFNGYQDYWNSFGNPNTATYGELFTAPSNGDNNLTSFSFYMGSPTNPGNIQLGGYIATWDGTHAGTLLYSSPFNYDNAGHEQITFNTGGLGLQGGQQYVMFLSVSNFYGQSVGETSVSQGGSINGLNGFAYYNNSGDFNALFNSNWDASGLSPDWAVDLEFNNGVPEPGSLMLLGTGLLGGLGMLRRKLF